jgi:hypothetical protein
MEAVSLKRPLIISAVFILVLVMGVWYLDTMFAAMLCLLAILWQILRLLYYAVRRNSNRLKLIGARFVMWVAAIVSMMTLFNHYSSRAQASGETVLAALQAHRAREGSYPEKLEALVPRDMAAIPMVALNPVREGKFRYRSNGKTFTLMYVTGFRMGSVYDSEAAKWEALD